jgi:hypothetical protein
MSFCYMKYGEKVFLLEDINSAMEEWSRHCQEEVENSRKAKKKGIRGFRL